MSSPSTFNLGAAYAALGIRSSRVLPSVAAGEITQTLQMGSVDTFAPQVVEGRGIFGSRADVVYGGGQWMGIFLQSLAPGGSLIEQILIENIPFQAASSKATLNVAPGVSPWVTDVVSPLIIGGQPVIGIARATSVPQAGGTEPLGSALGGSTLDGQTADTSLTGSGEVYRNIWVPSGWNFWVFLLHGGGVNVRFSALLRWREFPEALGAQ